MAAIPHGRGFYIGQTGDSYLGGWAFACAVLVYLLGSYSIYLLIWPADVENKGEKAALPWPGLRVAGESWCLFVGACEVRTAKQRMYGVRVCAWAALGWPGCRRHASSKLLAMAADNCWKRSSSAASECDERFWELNGELTEIVVVYSIELECNWRWWIRRRSSEAGLDVKESLVLVEASQCNTSCVEEEGEVGET